MKAPRALAFVGGVLVPLALFLILAEGVDGARVADVDRRVLRIAERLHDGALTAVVKAITFLGTSWGAAALTVVAMAVLLRYRRPVDAAFVAVAMSGSGILQYVAKLAFERPRPSVFEPLASLTTYSYPSGHAMASATLALALAIVCRHTRLRWIAVAGGIAFTLLVSSTRLYLGVHYPSDLLAGWLLSIAWVVTVVALFDLFGRPVGAAPGVAAAPVVPHDPSSR